MAALNFRGDISEEGREWSRFPRGKDLPSIDSYVLQTTQLPHTGTDDVCHC